MTDKEKILAKIELLINETNYEPYTDEIFSRINTLKELKSYIDSLQEEPVSEDLEEAAVEAFKQILDSDKNSFLEVFKAGANWQKKQDQETIELAEDHAMLAGMEKMKEQMMEKAIDAELYSDGMLTPLIKVNDKEKISNIKFGDKVKLTIIKEDENE